MISGIVTPQREPVIRLRIFGPAAEEEFETVIDTGFNDFLALPGTIIESLALSFEAPLLATLADGRVIETKSYRAAVWWDGVRREVLAVACDGGPLAGMSLLYGCDLHVEAVDGGTVRIERR
jgi:predicted aspartyl protease